MCSCFLFFFFKQKTAYEMRISDWSSDVCSSDLLHRRSLRYPIALRFGHRRGGEQFLCSCQAFMPAQISKGACRLGNNVTRNEHMRRVIEGDCVDGHGVWFLIAALRFIHAPLPTATTARSPGC